MNITQEGDLMKKRIPHCPKCDGVRLAQATSNDHRESGLICLDCKDFIKNLKK